MKAHEAKVAEVNAREKAATEQKAALDQRDKLIEEKERTFTQTHATKLSEIEAKSQALNKDTTALAEKQTAHDEKAHALEENKKSLEARIAKLGDKEKENEALTKSLNEVSFTVTSPVLCILTFFHYFSARQRQPSG